MNISSVQAARLKELTEGMQEFLFEIKGICKHAMSKSEYEQFRYKTLANLEPGLSSDSTWVVSNVTPLDEVAERAMEESEETPEEEEED